MNNIWQFDREFMKNTIAHRKKLLKDSNISLKDKRYIRNSIRILQCLINEQYNIDMPSKIKESTDMEKLKIYSLNKMKKLYKILGVELISWLMDLTLLGIFDLDTELKEQMTNLSIDEQATLTLENYDLHSKKYLNVAKEIIINKQIQFASNLTNSSFCIYDGLSNLSFLVINPNEAPWILNHEIQHAIENNFLYQNHTLLDELGPQYFELLFLDNLYKNQGYLLTGDYISKIEDARYFLDSLYAYLNCILIFAQINFNVTLDDFLETIIEQYEVDELTAYMIIKEELVTDEQYEDLKYLLSYLKAIELREKTILTKQDSSSILELHLNSNQFKFRPLQDNYRVYERFVEEVSQKTKILKK